jgi:hypothetical protein
MKLYAVTSQEVLERVSKHCPEALSTYIHCLNRADEKGQILFTRELVEQVMSESWTKIRNNLKKLALENLLEWHMFNNGFAVTLASLEDEENE